MSNSRFKMMQNIVFLIMAVAVLILGLAVAKPDPQAGQAPIICFGDSITEGDRLFSQKAYPYKLEKLLNAPVINEGMWGETSRHALQRIEKDVLSRKPRLVIIQFGGNDPSRQISLQETMANNERMVREVLEAGSVPVLLIGESNMLRSKYLEGFRSVAHRNGILLIENAIDDIVKDPRLTVDGVHPTPHGSELMAGRIFRSLESITY